MNKKTLLFLLMIVVSVLPALTAPVPVTFALNDDFDQEIPGEIKLYLGEVRLFPANNSRHIIIGDPNVVDVTRVTKDEITLTPKAAGSSSFYFDDAAGKQSFRVRVYAVRIEDLKKRVDDLLDKLGMPDIYSQANEEEEKVLILGNVKSQTDKDRIASATDTLKGNIMDLTVIKEEEGAIEIDVQVLELDEGSAKDLGFRWPTSTTITETGSPSIGVTALTEIGTSGLVTGGAPIGGNWGDLFRVVNASRNPFAVTINTLVQEGKARVLSHPRITCQSGKEAKLVVGGEVPILSATVSTGATSAVSPVTSPGNVTYKEFGIILNIKPEIMGEDRIHFNLNVEVSDVLTAVSTGYALAYPFTKRTASTELYLSDGETMGIGGLVKQKSAEDLNKFPFLADIPVLGAFFRERATRTGDGGIAKTNTELFITLTPKIVGKKYSANKESIARETPAKEIPVKETVKKINLPPEIAHYVEVIQAKIIRSIKYPEAAKNAGWEGKVDLNLNITSDGTLRGLEILKSAGYMILDDAAKEIAQNQAPYPPFPPQIKSDELWVEVPIAYKRN